MEQRLAILLDAFLMLDCFGVALALFELGDDFLKHLRMRDQIILDDALDLAALALGKRLRACRRRADHEHGGRDRDQDGTEESLHRKSSQLRLAFAGGL